MCLECTHNSMFFGVLTGLGAGSDTLLKHFPWYLILSLAACAHLRIHISLLLVRVELKPPGPLIFSPLTTGCVWFGGGCHSVRSSRCCPAFSLGLADGSFPVWPLLGRHSQGCAVLQTDRDGYGFLGKPGLSRSGPRVSVRSEVVLKLHVLERFLLCVDGSVCGLENTVRSSPGHVRSLPASLPPSVDCDLLTCLYLWFSLGNSVGAANLFLSWSYQPPLNRSPPRPSLLSQHPVS